MNKAELDLRHKLRDALDGAWYLTWHEDGRVNPGVPDVSFVMRHGSYETGWMELKAERKFTKNRVQFEIRQSQIDWITKHRNAGIPVFVLAAVGTEWWLLDGLRIKELVDITREGLHMVGYLGYGTLDALGGVIRPLQTHTERD